MAGEKKGKAYEAFVKVALIRLKRKGVLRESIFWEETPDKMTIKPDLTIGSDKDNPRISLLITHSGAAGNSHMKTWRNMGELAEAKVCLPLAPNVYNIAFDSVIKEDLKKVLDASFDGQLIVGDLRYGAKLQNWIDSNLKRIPKDKDDKVEFLESAAKSDKILKYLMKVFTKDLENLLKKKASPELDALWILERKRQTMCTTRVPRARNTFVRRGLSKMLIFENFDLAINLFSGKRIKADKVPAYAFELGLVGKAVGRATALDNEISNAVTLLGKTTLIRLLKKAPVDRMDSWIVSARNMPHLLTIKDYIDDKFDELVDPKILLRRLRTLHENPASLINKKKFPPNWPPKTVWLFELLIELVKLTNGNSTSYGYAQLEKDCAAINGMPAAGDPIYRTTIPGWVHRRRNIIIPHNVLKGISQILSSKLNAIGKREMKKLLSDENLKEYVNNIIEVKLCTYRMHQPLKILITDVLEGSTKELIRSCFGECAKLSGQATKTTLLKKNKTLINWQSAHSSHTNDKKKELCGRAVALRYSWDTDANKFIPRPNVQKLILVVDGTWKEKDLEAMARAGWDEIYYPDEMNKLAKAIV